MRKFHELVLRFRRDERGAFLVIFGILGLVLIATAGAVVDFTTIEQSRARAQDALDSAALGLQKTIYTEGVTEETLTADAQELLTERLNDEKIVATITDVTVTKSTGTLRIEARLTIPTAFVALVGVPEVSASVTSEVARGSIDLEVAVALDTTGSMGTPNPQKIIDLRAATNSLIDIIVQDNQEPTTTRMALVPYSQAVNLGSVAVNARGAEQGAVAVSGVSYLTGSAKSITAASYLTGSPLGINGITRASNGVVTTASNHGYSTGDTVYITGVSGMKQVNNKSYVITKVSNTTFRLNANSSRWSAYSTSSSDSVQKCTYSGCEVTVTSASHGFENGDAVVIKGTGGMSSFNNQMYVVSNKTVSTFTLTGSYGVGTSYQAGATAQKCQLSNCNVVVTVSTAPTRVAQTGDYMRVTGVNGITNVNNGSNPPAHLITVLTTTTFSIPVVGTNTSGTYSNGGSVQCMSNGCPSQYFQRQDGYYDTWYPTTCVTERIGPEAYTETSPATAPVGWNYRASGSPCIAQQVVPLTVDKVTLHDTANNLAASGSTGGHIGIAWAWYMLSPEFAHLWAEDRRPADYPEGPNEVIKVVIIMTDGAYNTTYRNGIIAKDSISGSGGSSEHINLNSSNGSSLTQGAAYCSAMKQDANIGDKVIVYTVGFDIASDTNAQNLLNGCATSPQHAYLASNGAQLLAAFQDIANNISQLRVTR
jgi:Flp pilus assembly protein TadG